MRAYCITHGAVLAMVGIAGFILLMVSGVAWGIIMFNVYALLWSPYVHAYVAAAGAGDPMLLGGRVSLGALTLHCEVIVLMMAPWAFIAARCFLRFIGLADDFFAHALNAGSVSR
jgi:hypothetical protein